MDVVRKSIGVLIIIFIGIPVLFGVIWAVGVTRAVVSPEFLSDLPQKIIQKVPAMIDEVLIEVDREDMVTDPNERAWVKAVATAKVSPKELLNQIGLMDWMQNELSFKFQQMGKMLRGEIPLKPMTLDLRPLKAALRHEAIKTYLVDLMSNLPPCNDTQKKEWAEAAENPRSLEHLPACRPAEMDLETSAMAISFVREHEITEIPDEVNLFKSHPRFHRGLDFMHSVTAVTYILFLIPAFFILLAALIGGTGKSGILRWMAVPTFIGGVSAYALSSVIKHAIPWSMALEPEAQIHLHGHIVTPFEQLVMSKAAGIWDLVIGQILKGVNSTAGIVCIVAIVLYALSYLISSESHSQQQQQPQQPQQPAPQPPTQSE